jgi:hypothetical protein
LRRMSQDSSTIVLYLLSVSAHSYKAKAIGYRTCYTTNLL